jgi:hypothetical protein
MARRQQHDSGPSHAGADDVDTIPVDAEVRADVLDHVHHVCLSEADISDTTPTTEHGDFDEVRVRAPTRELLRHLRSLHMIRAGTMEIDGEGYRPR